MIRTWSTIFCVSCGMACPAALLAGPTPAAFDFPSDVRVDAPTVPAPASFADLTVPGPFDVPSAYESIETGDGSGVDPHPMIPLPAAVWAALASLAGVAVHTVRQQRGARARR